MKLAGKAKTGSRRQRGGRSQASRQSLVGGRSLVGGQSRAGRRSPAGGPSRASRKSRVGRKPRAAVPKEVLLEFSMTPLDKGPSVSRYVSRSLDIIDRSGVAYRLNPMGTVLEGTWPEVWRVVSACFKRMREDCERISVAIKVDYRRGQEGRLSRKIATVERRVGRKLRT